MKKIIVICVLACIIMIGCASTNSDSTASYSSISETSDTTAQDIDLFFSITKNDADGVKNAIKDGANVNGLNPITFEENQEQATPLTYASGLDNRGTIIELLVNNGADINLHDTYDFTPLLIAAMAGQYENLKTLLELGANPNETDSSGVTPLIATNDPRMQRLLLDFGADPTIYAQGGYSALLTAASNNDLELVKRIVNMGADINLKNEDGTTPLMMAIAYNQIDVAKFLIEEGADINSTDNKGLTPLMAACQLDSIEMVQMLANSGAAINASGPEGISPLLFATMNKNTTTRYAICKILLDHGANVLIGADELICPVTASILAYDEYLTSIFINEMPDLNIPIDSGGNVVLSYCIANGYSLEFIKDLIAKGADVNAHEGGGRTILMDAITEKASNAIINFLISKGANVNERTDAGMTALHFACFDNNKEAVKILIESGADVNAISDDTITPLIIASGVSKDSDIINYLLEAGVDVKFVDKHGNTARDYAKENTYIYNTDAYWNLNAAYYK